MEIEAFGSVEAKQAAFIAQYEALMNGLAADEMVVFSDAVHPEHQSRPGVCQISCPPNSCGVSDFRGAVFAFWVQPDGSCGLPVAGLS